MANAVSCPSFDELQRFLVGRLADTEAQRVQQHLAGCTKCLEALNNLEAEDTLINAMQAQGQAGSRSEDAIVGGLVAHLGGLPPPGEREPDATCEGSLRECPGTEIGPYKLLQQIGEGGFGVVFMAEQTQPVRRKVALKVIKPGMDSRQVIARFEAERQALALMNHPNIAHVLDGGQTASGRPYFVMELVRGIPITEFCDQSHLSIRERLALFVSVCQAVQHAHQKGIIHRDLKPTNILVTMHDSVPLVKVIDFGIAKATGQQLTEKTLFTNFAQMIGTPMYMSPEQAQMSAADVDTRSDIYSLGVLLYELLTGTTPFDKERLRTAAYDEIRRIIREEEPAKPSNRMSTLGQVAATVSAGRKSDPQKLSQLFRGELDWIVMKALDKDRNRRYETASAYAADVQRYLADEAVQACPPSVVYRLRKFVRRNKGPVLAASLVILALVGGIIGTTWGMLRATDAEANAVAQAKQKEEQRATAVTQGERATRAERDARKRLFDAKLAEAKTSRSSRQPGQRFETWKAVTEAARLARELELGEETLMSVRDEAIACLTLPNVRVVKEEWEGFPAGSSGSIALDDAFEHYARSDTKGNISVRSIDDDRQLALLPGQGEGPDTGSAQIRFSRRGDLLAVRYWHLLPGQPTNFQVWDWRERKVLFQPLFPVHSVAWAFTPDGRQLVLGHDRGTTLTIHETATFKETGAIQLNWTAAQLAFDPEGSRLAVTALGSKEIQVRDLANGEVLQNLPVPAGVGSLSWHSDGALLAAGCQNMLVNIWETATWHQHAVLSGHHTEVVGVAFAPAGDLLLSFAYDDTSRLWDPWTGRELVRLSGQAGPFSRDGRRMLNRSGSKLSVLEVAPGRECRALPWSRSNIQERFLRGGFSPDGRWLAVATGAGARLWDVAHGKQIAFLPVFETASALFHPSGKELLTSGSAGLFRWPLAAQAGSLKIGPAHKVPGPGTVWGVTTDKESRKLVVFERQSSGWVLNSEQPLNPIRLFGHTRAVDSAVSPDGQWVAAGTHNGQGVRIWNARTGEILDHLFPDHRHTTVAFSPDGRWLTTGTDNAFDLWETGPTAPWKLAGHIDREQHGEVAGLVAFSPDGKVLAIPISPFVVQLRDAATLRQLARLQSPENDAVVWLGFSPDGSQLAMTTIAKHVRLWDLRLIGEQLKTIGLDWDMPPYPRAPPPGDAKPMKIEVDLGDLRPEFLAQRALAAALWNQNKPAEAIACFRKAIELNPESAEANNDLAWALATCADGKLRDPPEAVVWANKAVQIDPNGFYWQTLGYAEYRGGNWKAAIAALEKVKELGSPGDSLEWFPLAMAHWQLGEKDEAREWYDRAVAWMDKNAPTNEELRRFRAEAEELLEIEK